MRDAACFPTSSGQRGMIPLHNPYQDSPPDFAKLAEAEPSFAPFLRRTAGGLPTIDFKDERALRALTIALLHHDFQLAVSLPSDRLCPIVPGRLEYVLWILQVAATALRSEPSSLSGIDIGTGASAIYPLLACRASPNVSMVATDVDDYSLRSAAQNIKQNGLQNRIKLVLVDPAAELFPPTLLADDLFDFCMCNPPFYSSIEEVQASESAKSLEPFAVCTGGALEMITLGGEVQFVTKMFKESLLHPHAVRWYSSLFGKFSSIGHVVKLIKEEGITNFAVHELGQGQTKRWIVAWSHQDIRLPDTLARASSPALAKLLPLPNHLWFTFPSRPSLVTAAAELQAIFVKLSFDARWLSQTECDLTAWSNTWSRGARRKKARSEEIAISTSAPLLTSRARLSNDGDELKLGVDWLQGTNRQAFTGLWSHIMRKLAEHEHVDEMDVT